MFPWLIAHTSRIAYHAFPLGSISSGNGNENGSGNGYGYGNEPLHWNCYVFRI